MDKSEIVAEVAREAEVKDIRSLLDESIVHIANGWISQLNALRKNATDLEGQVLAAVANTKNSIEKLHSLGALVAEEAQRGMELCAKLSESVERITGEAVTTAEAAE